MSDVNGILPEIGTASPILLPDNFPRTSIAHHALRVQMFAILTASFCSPVGREGRGMSNKIRFKNEDPCNGTVFATTLLTYRVVSPL